MSENKRLWDPWKMYDTTPTEMRAIKERAKMRQALKADWTKKYTNPWKGAHDGGFLFDPAVQRFISLKATQPEHFRGTFRSAVLATLIFVVPVTIISYLSHKKHERTEKAYRNGEVLYKDRRDKFLY